jgi:hypothetical protein
MTLRFASRSSSISRSLCATVFDYITDPANWRVCGPRLVRMDSATRWREPGDRACVVQRILGREVELDMTLVRI